MRLVILGEIRDIYLPYTHVPENTLKTLYTWITRDMVFWRFQENRRINQIKSWLRLIGKWSSMKNKTAEIRPMEVIDACNDGLHDVLKRLLELSSDKTTKLINMLGHWK